MNDEVIPVASNVTTARRERVMGAVRWALLALVTLLALFSVSKFWLTPGGSSHAGEHAELYTCPMHPEVRSHEPGECPICHMDLVPVAKGRASDADAAGAEGHDHGASHAPGGVTAVTLSAEAEQAAGIRTTAALRTKGSSHLRAAAVVSAPETGVAEVRVRSPGFVERVLVRQSGVKVSAGQPLAYVFSPELYRAQEEFITALAWSEGAAVGAAVPNAPELALASRRGLELLGMSKSEIDEVARTKKPLQRIALVAPQGGFVTRFGAILGSRAEPTMVLYEISDLSKVWVIASLGERDVQQIAAKGPVRFFPNGEAGEPRQGQVELIEPTVDEGTRTSRVRIALDNADGRLRPGQYGQVEFDLPTKEVVLVPRDSVIRTGAADYVYVRTEKGRFAPRSVVVGALHDGQLEIESGLEAGEEIVSRGSFVLDSESRLRASFEGVSADGAEAAAAP